MSQQILLKRTGVVNRNPTIGQLDIGEVAINYRDGKLYFKRIDGVVENIVSLEFSNSGKVGNALNINGNFLELLDRDGNIISDVDISALSNSTALEISFDNISSGLLATNVQDAIDEISFLSGVGSLYHEHNQTILASTWSINHNLNRYPNITILDTLSNKIEGDISYIDKNNVLIHFKKAGVPFNIGGTAYLA